MKRALVLWAAAVAVACVRPEESPACSPATLLAIEEAYVRDVLQHCISSTIEECAAMPVIEAHYAALREEWIRCR